MYATNTLNVTEKQEDFYYKVIESKLTKLGFDENKTNHFSFKGTRLNISGESKVVHQVIFEFGNNGEFYNLSCDLTKTKGIRIKTLTLEDQNYYR